MREIIEATNWQMEKPKPFGWFHIIFIFLTIVISAIILKFHQNDSERQIRKTIFFMGLFLIVIEIYKQFYYNIGITSFYEYEFNIFPFQFCSTPLYIYPLIGIIKKHKFREALERFSAYYILLAGFLVMIYPGSAFTESVTISIHTMLWHGTMVVSGLYLFVNKGYGKSIDEVISGCKVFLVLTIIATILNIIFYKVFHLDTLGKTFNMFFLSPYYENIFPVFKEIQKYLGWLPFFILYQIVFTGGAIIIYLISNKMKKFR